MSDELTIVFILHENDRTEIRRIADLASTPNSDADHIDRAALRKLVRLPDAERSAVPEWIQKSGMRHLDVRSMSGQTIFVQTTIEQLAKVFGAECLTWLQDEDGSVVPPAEWTIPRQMACYVQSAKLRHRGNRARSTMVG